MAVGQAGQDHLPAAADLAAKARSGVLATVEAGMPHAALVTPAWLPGGVPLLLLSILSVHTRQLQANPACSLLLIGPAAGENPQTTPRLLLSGLATPVDHPAAAGRFLKIHPYAALYAGFTDFGYWQVSLQAAYYVGGFASASVLNVAALQHAINLAVQDPEG